MDPEVLLEGLDEEQRAAVTSSAMPLVVMAPAGSGKTRVLTRRIAHRVAIGEADPRHVLALTFTRKAAGELDQRLRRLGLRSEATTGTFHAVAWGVLRVRWSDQRRSAPSLLDRKGRLLAEIAPSLPGRDRRSVAGDLANEIEWAKARMVAPDGYEAAVRAAVRKPPLRPALVAEVYAAYETRKGRGGLVDFDDLLTLCAQALEEDPTFATAQRWRFRHLFVDELQDVNPLQFRLLEAWRGDRYDVTAVGDPQQAIYGWNGADAGFLLDIHRWWRPAEVMELSRSYRSTPEILEGAAAVLRGARQAARTIVATRPSGAVPELREFADDRAEALAIARSVRLSHAPGRPWGEQAILVRTHAQTRLLVEALRGAGIPHRVRGGAAFLDRPEVRRTLRDLRASQSPLGTALADLQLHLEAKAADAVEADDPDGWGDPTEEDEGNAALSVLLQMGRDYLRLDPTGRADTFGSWVRATIQAEGEGNGARGDAVDVTTFHAAKGLEWAVVHLAGVEEGFVPISHARTAAARAEEARLCYVAMTRAERDLHITWARTRTFAGKVVERRRSPLLDPLVAAIGAQSSPAVAADPQPPVDDWAADVSAHRQRLGDVGAPPALQRLREWRHRTARAARIEDAAVLPDHVLHRIVDLDPRDVDALGQVRGVGPILARRFGLAILAALATPADVSQDA